ncbi:MAG: hypothetical protein FJ241_11890 [Nitrospira sp.]|nr:hypothetical protein [Nitrospira sp.]
MEFIISQEQDDFIKRIISDIEKYIADHKINPKLKLLYIPSFYQIRFTRIFDIFMASSLLLRGLDVISVITGFFHPKECIIYGGIYRDNRQYNLGIYNYVETTLWVDFLKQKFVHLPDFRTTNDIEIAKEISSKVTFDNYSKIFYRDYPAGEKAAIATLNMNNLPEIIDKKEIVDQLKIHVENIVELMSAYERVFDTIKPDVVFSNIPFYYKWGLAFHIAKKRNIPFYSAFLGERKNTFFFSYNSDKLLDCSPAWLTFKERIIDNRMKEMIEDAISKRSHGNVAHFSPYPEPHKHTPEFQEMLSKIEPIKPLVFFPVNVFFDAIVFQKTPAFSNLVDMLDKTMDFFSRNSHYQLIIKAHPSERLFYNMPPQFSRYCLKNILSDLQKEAKENIIFLDYNTSISTYDLIPLINLGIVYTSSTAVEMSWFGKPVIALADSHYQSKGFTYQPESTENYFELIHKILKDGEPQSVIDERIELSKKYYFLYYYHGYVDFKMLQGSDTHVVEDKLLLKSYEDLLPGKNKALDYICDSIINKLPIFGDNRWPPYTGEEEI